MKIWSIVVAESILQKFMMESYICKREEKPLKVELLSVRSFGSTLRIEYIFYLLKKSY